MIDELYNKVIEKDEVRQNLIAIRAELKGEEREQNRERLLHCINGNFAYLCSLLVDSDPKVRKNCALILGTLAIQETLWNLWNAYESEQTLYVRSSYLAAIAEMDYRNLLPAMKKVMTELEQIEPAEEEKKHRAEEQKLLREMLITIEGCKSHRFTGYDLPCELVLLTNRNHIHVTSEQLKGMKFKEFSAGVMVQTDCLKKILPIRTYEEILFVIPSADVCSKIPEQAAETIAKSGLLTFLQERHEGEMPYYFRIEMRGQLELDRKAKYVKRMAAELERITKQKLINSTKNYEIEIRLVPGKDETYRPLLKLFTVKDERFSYRKEVVASSIRPVNSALSMELVKDYLREGAQVLDPFCGTGTMLLERAKIMPVGTMYGLDIFGEAIEKARKNANMAECRVSFINRDFFDFKHEYLFDEVIANMPMSTGSKQDASIVQLYTKFFRKVQEHLAEDGVIILYSHDRDIVRRLFKTKPFTIEREFEISMREGSYVFVIKMCAAA